jgi:hypothetical protein
MEPDFVEIYQRGDAGFRAHRPADHIIIVGRIRFMSSKVHICGAASERGSSGFAFQIPDHYLATMDLAGPEPLAT